MAEIKSPEQVREQRLRDMGPELGPIYHALSNDVTWLHAKWNQYRQLYAHSAEQIGLQNRTAGYFFGIVQGVLLEDVILHLARLTDAPRSVGRDNLSLQWLSEAIPDPSIAAEIRTLVDAAHVACEPVREWRNRRLAHQDLALVLATATDPLPGISRAHVETTLVAIRAVLNGLERHYWDSQTAYRDIITQGGDAESLIYYLRAGMKCSAPYFMRQISPGHPGRGGFETRSAT